MHAATRAARVFTYNIYHTQHSNQHLLRINSVSFCAHQEAISAAPKSLGSLLEVLLPHLQPRAEVKGVSLEDQQALVNAQIEIIISKLIFVDMKGIEMYYAFSLSLSPLYISLLGLSAGW